MAQREADEYDALEQQFPQGISAAQIVDFFTPRGVKLAQATAPWTLVGITRRFIRPPCSLSPEALPRAVPGNRVDPFLVALSHEESGPVNRGRRGIAPRP